MRRRRSSKYVQYNHASGRIANRTERFMMMLFNATRTSEGKTAKSPFTTVRSQQHQRSRHSESPR